MLKWLSSATSMVLLMAYLKLARCVKYNFNSRSFSAILANSYSRSFRYFLSAGSALSRKYRRSRHRKVSLRLPFIFYLRKGISFNILRTLLSNAFIYRIFTDRIRRFRSCSVRAAKGPALKLECLWWITMHCYWSLHSISTSKNSWILVSSCERESLRTANIHWASDSFKLVKLLKLRIAISYLTTSCILSLISKLFLRVVDEKIPQSTPPKYRSQLLIPSSCNLPLSLGELLTLTIRSWLLEG